MRDSSSTSGDDKQTFRYMQVAAIGAILLIAAIIYTFTHISSQAPADAMPTIQPSPPYRQKVPQFEWSNGNAHLNSLDLEGGWSLLSFWSTTCAPCLEELPDLDQFNDNWSGPELAIHTVNIDPQDSESVESTKQFLINNDIQLPVIYDTEGKLKKIFAVTDIPRHFLINPKGVVVWQARGAFNWTAPESEKTLLSIMERDKARQ
jgi:thiol-disulfide isomerase/thioredoxin